MSKKNKERKQTTSCGGVAYRLREGVVEVLLIKQFANKERWGLPKGHIDEGETREECAVREIKEETGVDVTLSARLPDCYVSNGSEDKTVVTWLAVPAGNDEPKHDDPDSEVADARWFDVANLPEIVSYQRSTLALAIKLIFERMEGGNVPHA